MANYNLRSRVITFDPNLQLAIATYNLRSLLITFNHNLQLATCNLKVSFSVSYMKHAFSSEKLLAKVAGDIFKALFVYLTISQSYSLPEYLLSMKNGNQGRNYSIRSIFVLVLITPKFCHFWLCTTVSA